MTRSTVLATILLLALASQASSQNAWRDILERQLTAVGNTDALRGYRPDPNAFHTDMIVGTLYAGNGVGLEVDLEFGVEYMIIGVCDADCSDLDLSLTDLQSNVLFEDLLDDDVPILGFTSPSSGVFFLNVDMYECSLEPCSFGYKVYRR